MTEPTRDPRLLSAEQLANCKAMYGQHGDVQKLLAHIAALVEAVQELVEAVTGLDPFRPSNVAFYQRNDDDNRTRVRKALAALAQPPGDE